MNVWGGESFILDSYVLGSITRTIVNEVYLLAKYFIWQPRLYMGMQIRGIASDGTTHRSIVTHFVT